MRVLVVTASGNAREPSDHSAPLTAVVDQALQRFGDRLVVREDVQAFAARPKFARGLRAAQQQQADHRVLVLRELQFAEHRVAQALPVLHHAASEILVARDERFFAQVARGAFDGSTFQRHHGLPARLLVAGRRQCIQRQRALIGRQNRLLHEAADNARLDGAQVDAGHGTYRAGWAANGSRRSGDGQPPVPLTCIDFPLR